MTVKTWNNLVLLFMCIQFALCVGVLLIANSVPAHAAALTWIVIGIPCMFGFIINDLD